MSATLSQTEDDGVVHAIPCSPVMSLGRSASNDVVLKQKRVSRNHAVIRCLARNDYYVIDLGSANGTYVNSDRVVTPRILADGDAIRIGESTFTFHIVKQRGQPDAEDDEECATVVATLEPTIMNVTVLVADIRGYTAMSERITVGLLARVIAAWFRSASEVIERHGGVVDKFMGDAVMARWLVDGGVTEETVLRSLRAANELSVMTGAVAESFPDFGAPLRIGVGISTGKAAVGVMASGRPQDFTVLGDSVNLAFRLESATKELKTDVILGENTFKYLGANWTEGTRCSISVKGRDEPLKVCCLTFDQLAAIVTGDQTTEE